MQISMYAMSVPIFVKSLGNLSAILDKGEAFSAAKKIDPAVLINMRLAPDMFPLLSQVRIACDFAKGAAARLAGEEPPKWDDNEATFADLRARIARTIEFVQGFDPARFDAAAERPITVHARRARAIHRPALSGACGAAELLLPHDDRLRHPAPRRRRTRQARFRRQGLITASNVHCAARSTVNCRCAARCGVPQFTPADAKQRVERGAWPFPASRRSPTNRSRAAAGSPPAAAPWTSAIRANAGR
jgi:hypothetical protein